MISNAMSPHSYPVARCKITLFYSIPTPQHPTHSFHDISLSPNSSVPPLTTLLLNISLVPP